MSRPLVVICDVAHQRFAEGLGKVLLAPVFLLGELVPGAMEGADLVVDANLRDPASVAALKQLLKVRGKDEQRYFIYDAGQEGRAWKVQSDALGATEQLERNAAARSLRKARSMLVGHRTRTAPGPAGPSMAAAERSIARMFEGLIETAPLSAREVAIAGREVLRGVGEVGGANWLTAVKSHHEGTFQHCLLVAGVAAIYAKAAGFDNERTGTLMNAAILHDVGKAAIPLHVLDKAGRLTDEEFAVIKRHPAVGFDYLSKHSSATPEVLDAVRHHHEALDGTGYPDGLSAEQIPELTRILTVCDIYAALIERRAYKEEKTPADAVTLLVDMALRSKVDYRMVRQLSLAVGVPAEDTLEDVLRAVTMKKRRAS